jgi:hypothetical protein
MITLSVITLAASTVFNIFQSNLFEPQPEEKFHFIGTGSDQVEDQNFYQTCLIKNGDFVSPKMAKHSLPLQITLTTGINGKQDIWLT